MPALRQITRDDLSSSSSTPSITEASTRSNSRIWIPVAVVVGSILLAAALASTLVVYFRRRGYRQARRDDPALSHAEFLRRRKMTAAERQREEELQRRVMIRKSLVSRSTMDSMEWNVPQQQQQQSDNRSLGVVDERDKHEEDNEHEGSAAAGLKEDWKEWEARMMRERPEMAYRHPATNALPDLPVPTKSRARSLSRGSLLRGESPS